jgi:hypothetical protein
MGRQQRFLEAAGDHPFHDAGTGRLEDVEEVIYQDFNGNGLEGGDLHGSLL